MENKEKETFTMKKATWKLNIKIGWQHITKKISAFNVKGKRTLLD